MSPDESQRNIVASVRGKMVSITGGSTYWRTNPANGPGFGNAFHAQPLESTSSDATRSAPRSLEEALAEMETRSADASWDYAEPEPREVPFDIEIEAAVDGGYLLIYEPVDGSLYGNDTFHETQEDAEQVALEQFGVQAHEWQRQL
jgi:hypothetical protein